MNKIISSIVATTAPLLIACFDTPDSNENVDQCTDSGSPGDCTGGGTREYAVMTCEASSSGLWVNCAEAQMNGGYTFDCEFDETAWQCVETNVQYFNVSQVILVEGFCSC